jgi:hypothetical protein
MRWQAVGAGSAGVGSFSPQSGNTAGPYAIVAGPDEEWCSAGTGAALGVLPTGLGIDKRRVTGRK